MDNSMVEENGGNSTADPLAHPTTDQLSDSTTTGGSGTGSGSGAVEGASVTANNKQSMHQQQQQQQLQQQQHHSEFPANMLTAHSPGLTVLKNSPSSNIVHLITTPSGATLQSTVIQPSVIQSANNLQQVPKTVVYTSSGGGGGVQKGNSVIQAPGIKIKSEPQFSNNAMHQMESSDEDDSCSDDDAASRRRRDMLTRRPSYHKILKEISGPDMSVLSGPVVPEDQSRKREIRLQKNREAARECRRKKKEYIKCLENRVAVLENQNKALIEELKSLKELYCMSKTE